MAPPRTAAPPASRLPSTAATSSSSCASDAGAGPPVCVSSSSGTPRTSSSSAPLTPPPTASARRRHGSAGLGRGGALAPRVAGENLPPERVAELVGARLVVADQEVALIALPEGDAGRPIRAAVGASVPARDQHLLRAGAQPRGDPPPTALQAMGRQLVARLRSGAQE